MKIVGLKFDFEIILPTTKARSRQNHKKNEKIIE